MSCEKSGAFSRTKDAIENLCAHTGIHWHPVPYRISPPVIAGIINSLNLRRTARRLHGLHNFDMVHCRSYIPAMAGLSLKRGEGVPLIFDMRGFWPEEKTEGGSWPQDRLLFRRIYSYFKARESELLSEADHIISLTHNGKAVLESRTEVSRKATPVTVIPCCADLDHFPLITPAARCRSREQLGLQQSTSVLAYLGSVGAWYMLDEMLDLFRRYQLVHPDAQFLFITPSRPEMIRQAAASKGIDAANLVIRFAQRNEVPAFMAAADASVFFIKPVSSKRASSPTKMGELISMGLPIITNSGVGDVDRIVHETGCGVLVSSFDQAGYDAAIRELETMQIDVKACRAKARPWFDLAMGVERYDEVYRSLTT